MKRVLSLMLAIGIILQGFKAYAEDKMKDLSISQDEYMKSLSEYTEGKRKFIPVYPKQDKITLDGDDSEWEVYPEIEAKRIKSYFSGTPDATLHLKFTYDDEYFYVLARSKDDIWSPAVGTQYWNGDCLQLGFSQLGEKFVAANNEYGVSYDKSAEKPYLKRPDLTKAYVSRKGNITLYELSFSWKEMYGEKPDSFLFCVIAGDNDGGGRKYCVELSDGISGTKTNAEFPCMVLMSEERQSFMYVEGTSNGETYQKTDYSVNIFNGGDEREITCKSDFLGINKKITVPSKSFITKVYPLDFGEKYGQREIDLSNGDEILSYGMEVYVNPTYTFFEERILQLDKRIEEIEELISKCNEKGIPTDYENVNLAIMQMFSKNIKSDIEIKHTEHIEYNFAALDEVYEDARSRLTSYIMGTGKVQYAARVSADKPIDIVGNSFWGYADINGTEEYRPVFLQGYGHFNRVGSHADLMYNIGTSYIAQELGPRNILKQTGEYPYWDGISINKEWKREITVQSEEKYSGKKALKIVNEHQLTSQVYGSVTQSLLVKPNTKYRFGGMIKSKNAKGLKITLNNWSNYNPLPQNTNGWEPFEFEFETGDGTYNTVLRLITEDLCDECYLDSFYVYEDGSDINLIKNHGFEDTPEKYGDMIVDYNSNFGGFISRIANAEKNNLKVGINLSPHYFPSYMTSTYPDLGVGSPGFNKFRVDDERSKAVMELYIRALLDAVKDYGCVADVCLSNEPVYSANVNECYVPLWQDYLKGIYNDDINLLNEHYESNYTSFDEVQMPGEKEATVRNYDYARFNNDLLLKFHEWMAEVVHKFRPDLPVHAKLMSDMQGAHDKRSRGFYNYGYAWEDYAGITDVIGFDGGSGYKPGEFLVDSYIESTHLTQWFKTDFITSIKNAPWINSETHIVSDKTFDFSMDAADHIGRYMWQEGIHGVGASAVWVFDDIKRDKLFQGSIFYRPDAQLDLGKSALDLNRLSYEVNAVSNAKRNIGLLYSYSARNYNDILDNSMINIYSGITFNGLKTKFISDRKPEDLNSDIDILFVPNAVCVMPQILDSIIKYQDGGGKVVIFGEDSLTRDERNAPQDAQKVKKIQSRADIIPVTGEGYVVVSPRMSETQGIIDKYIFENNLAPVTVIDADTGKKVEDIEWEYNIYKGKLILNVCSYHNYHDQTNISIYVNGKKLEHFKELRTGNTYADTITVDPGTPVLIQADIDNPFFDTYGHWAEKAVESQYKKDIISGKTASEFDPDGALTFAEWVTLVVRKLGIEPIQTADTSHWAAPYIEAAKSMGIIADMYKYDSEITRAEMCEIIVAALEKTKGKAIEGAKVSFNDINAYNSEALSKAVALGIVSGYENNTFRPYSNLTRAEAASILERIL